MVDKHNITDKYYHILELLDKSPGDEEALNALIGLEEDIKSYLFDVLKSKHSDDFDKSNVYSKFGKGNKDRDRLESLIMNKTTGDRLSINDITDLFIKKINDILAMPINNQEKIKLLNIQYLQIKETILPPDYYRKPIIGSGNGWIEKGEDFDRFGLLIQILREQGVYTDDILAIEGVNKKNMMRRDSYIYLYIPRIDKTIFINNNYGEATFVYDGSMEIEWFTSLGKEGLKSDFKKIIFSEKNIDLWKNEILHALFHSGDKKEKILGEKIDVRVIKNDIRKRYHKQAFIDVYARLSEEEKQKILNRSKYTKRAKQYPNFPQTHAGLISLLGGNPKCREGGYIKALVEGKGEEYFNKRNKTEKEKKQKFLDFYGTLKEEERQKTYSQVKYIERAKQHPELPKSYEGLIILLGGRRGCAEGGYVKALVEGTGEEYIKEREIRTNKSEEEKNQEFLDVYERLSEEEKQKIYFGKKYRERVKKYPGLPQSYNGLIPLFGGNAKCQDGGYIKALIEGTGEEYFNNWEKGRK